MKNSGRLFLLVFFSILVIVATAVGCGQSSGLTIPTGYLPGSVGTTCTVNAQGVCVPISGALPTFTTGDTETLTLTNSYSLNEYEGESVYSPGTIQVNLSLNPIPDTSGVNDYLGTMNIFFQDGNGTVHNGTFTNGQSPTQKYNSYYNDYNQLQSNGTYRLFFEDAVGAIIVDIPNGAGTDTTTTATAQIYFMNFNSSAPNPLFQGSYDGNGNYFPPGYVYCWMIDLGPYNCRNFGVPPQNVYGSGDQQVGPFTELGTFPVNVNAALGL